MFPSRGPVWPSKCVPFCLSLPTLRFQVIQNLHLTSKQAKEKFCLRKNPVITPSISKKENNYY